MIIVLFSQIILGAVEMNKIITFISVGLLVTSCSSAPPSHKYGLYNYEIQTYGYSPCLTGPGDYLSNIGPCTCYLHNGFAYAKIRRINKGYIVPNYWRK